jgi:hypothetical protein
MREVEDFRGPLSRSALCRVREIRVDAVLPMLPLLIALGDLFGWRSGGQRQGRIANFSVRAALESMFSQSSALP